MVISRIYVEADYVNRSYQTWKGARYMDIDIDIDRGTRDL
jgi:hypothetical protein